MQAVVLGSFKDIEDFLSYCKEVTNKGYIVFPSEDYFKDNKLHQIIDKQHANSVPEALTNEQEEQLAVREGIYLRQIYLADKIFVCNKKCGKEHVGVATAFEIGFALALHKSIEFRQVPSDQHMKVLINEKFRVW